MPIIGFWEDEPVLGKMPDILDPFPFTREGRRMQALEHELSLERARLKVDALQAQRREVQAKLDRLRKRP